MRILAALLTVKILAAIGAAIVLILALKTLVAGPGFNQSSVHGEVFI
jgi:hypothetical protein